MCCSESMPIVKSQGQWIFVVNHDCLCRSPERPLDACDGIDQVPVCIPGVCHFASCLDWWEESTAQSKTQEFCICVNWLNYLTISLARTSVTMFANSSRSSPSLASTDVILWNVVSMVFSIFEAGTEIVAPKAQMIQPWEYYVPWDLRLTPSFSIISLWTITFLFFSCPFSIFFLLFCKAEMIAGFMAWESNL